uniref:Uncharacterized protein n=1 Tax=Romanomermis culicivorax TaxID=13658 RepID=A0A915IJ12_ROMCU
MGLNGREMLYPPICSYIGSKENIKEVYQSLANSIKTEGTRVSKRGLWIDARFVAVLKKILVHVEMSLFRKACNESVAVLYEAQLLGKVVAPAAPKLLPKPLAAAAALMFVW